MNVMAMDLQATNKEKKSVLTLKVHISTLEKEVATLREKLTKYCRQSEKWMDRYGKLANDYQTLQTTVNTTPGGQNTIVQ